MDPNPNPTERGRGPRKRARAGNGHAPDPAGQPLCGAQPQELRFADPPTCSQCKSVLSLQAGRVKKKKNRSKGKHAKGPGGSALCGVEAKKVHFSKEPSCVDCKAALGRKAENAPAPKRGGDTPVCVACLERELKGLRQTLDPEADGSPRPAVAALEARLAEAKAGSGRAACPRCRAAKRVGKRAARAKAKEAKKADWVFTSCPVCEASLPEHRLERHMKKVHTGAR